MGKKFVVTFAFDRAVKKDILKRRKIDVFIYAVKN